MKAELAIHKAIPNADTIRFVTKKLETLRSILAPTEEKTTEEKLATMSPEKKSHFQKLIRFVGEATSAGRYSLTEVGSNQEEFQQFAKLLN